MLGFFAVIVIETAMVNSQSSLFFHFRMIFLFFKNNEIYANDTALMADSQNIV